MRLLDRLFTRQQNFFQEATYPGASFASVLTTSFGMTPNREPILQNFAQYSSNAFGGDAVVFGCMALRMRLFSEMTFKYQSKEDKHLYGDTSLAIFERPWPNGTTGELLAAMILDADLAGNCFIWNAGDRLVRLRPDWITIVSHITPAPSGGRYREVIGYHYEPPPASNESALTQDFTPEEVVHWNPIPDPTANFRGMSWLTPVVREVTADIAMTEYKIKFINNAATPNMLIKYDRELRDDTIDKIAEKVRAKHGGVENAFRTLVLDRGADATVIGTNFDQLQHSVTQTAGADRIHFAAGVPKIVGYSREAHYPEEMRRFADLTMRPLWRSACAAMHQFSGAPESGVRLWFDLHDIAALRQSETERAQAALVRGQALLAYVQAGYTRESAINAVEANDVTQLKVDPIAIQAAKLAAKPPPQPVVQHMLPQTSPGATAKPLPAGANPRIGTGASSPGKDGHADTTRPTPRPMAGRRSESNGEAVHDG